VVKVEADQVPLINQHGSGSRLEWLDVVKGVGIILLVVLHVEVVSDGFFAQPIVRVLKLFRMPMFFIISGMLFTPRDPADYAWRKVRSLLVPYASFMLAIWVAIALRAVLTGLSSQYLTLHGVKIMMLGGERLTGEYGIFWFMTCLFFTQNIYNVLIVRWPDPIWWVAPRFATPLAVGTVPFGMTLLWFGHVMKVHRPSSRLFIVATAIVVVSALAAKLAGYYFDMDLKYAEPGVPLISLALAIVVTWAFFQAVKPVVRIRKLSASLVLLGKASMVVMFLHQYVHWTMRRLGVTSDVSLIAAGVFLPCLIWLFMKRSTLLRATFLGDEKSQRSLATMRPWPLSRRSFSAEIVQRQ
jgi:fucose 4-O-acetylase-like acetyltransferase